MKPNPVLRRLGLSDNDRVAILHTDDIGMCLASVAAFEDLWQFGLISSGAVMMPCPWALKAARYAGEHPQVDLGVHSTLTSEWKTYRWRALSTRDPLSGLLDEEGFLPSTTRQVHQQASPAAVQAELEAQVQAALHWGMQPTHIDTHMGAVASLHLIPVYLKVALAHSLPAMWFRMPAEDWRARGLDAQTAETAVRLMNQLEEIGLPLLDAIRGLDLSRPEGRLEHAKETLRELKPGITHFIIHPSKDMPELREIAPDWRARVADYETFMRDDLRSFVREQGIQVIGYRALQAFMPDPKILSVLPL